jgi:hypothetical protein
MLVRVEAVGICSSDLEMVGLETQEVMSSTVAGCSRAWVVSFSIDGEVYVMPAGYGSHRLLLLEDGHLSASVARNLMLCAKH